MGQIKASTHHKEDGQDTDPSSFMFLLCLAFSGFSPLFNFVSCFRLLEGTSPLLCHGLRYMVGIDPRVQHTSEVRREQMYMGRYINIYNQAPSTLLLEFGRTSDMPFPNFQTAA